MGVVAHRLLGIASAGRNNFAPVEEAIDDGNRLIKQTAGIVAKVENKALEPGSRDVIFKFLNRRANPLKGLFVELGDSNVADIVAFLMLAHRFDLNHSAGQLDIERVFAGAAQNLENHRGVRGAAHLVDRLIEAQALNVLIVDGGDNIARQYPRARGRGIVDWRHDLDRPVFLGDLNTKTTKLAASLNLHVAEALGVHVTRMRVKRTEHAVDRRLNELLLVRLLDIIGADFLENIAEEIEITVGIRGGGTRRSFRKT